MLDLTFGRDLVVLGVVFGFAAFVWAGWAQERPPSGVIWRIVLGAVGALGLAIVGLGIPTAVRNWSTPTAIDPGSGAFAAYVIVVVLEVIAMVVLSVVLTRRHRSELIAPTVLTIVGVHFVPLAFVFAQPLILLAAILVTAAGLVALRARFRSSAPSFIGGLLAAPVFIVLGAVALIAGRVALDA